MKLLKLYVEDDPAYIRTLLRGIYLMLENAKKELDVYTGDESLEAKNYFSKAAEHLQIHKMLKFEVE